MSSALAAELREHFDFGDVDAPEIGQCAELCKRYATNAEDLAAEWDLHSKKMGKVLSLATLEEFRMQVLEKKATRQQLALSRQQFASRPAGRPVALTKESLHLLAAPDGRKRGRDSDAAGVKSEAFGTPAAGTAAARGDAVSPLTQPASQQYTERDNAGKVEASLHPEVAAPPPPEPRALEVDVDEWRATQPIGRHMWERLEDKAEALDRHTHALGRAICAAAGLDEPTNVLRATVEETTAVGRIVCDSEGKINSNSVFLETTRASSAGVRVKLELQDVANYAVFRGQVVAVRGTNARGTAITVREVFSAAPRAPPAPTAGDGGARVLVASGPFTTDDSLTYEPLRDLLDAAERQAVDALVLVGPFVDEAHPAVRSANVGDLTFEIVYRNQVVEMLLRWLKARREASGREPPTIVLCASTADVHAHPTFPQGPLETRGPGGTSDPRLISVRNPATFRIGGYVFGVSAADCVKALSAEECARVSGPPSEREDRMTRLSRLVVEQRVFLPVYPPPKDMAVDTMLSLDVGALPVTPHVLILPSDLTRFARVACGVVCVNPGKLVRRMMGGTYALVNIGAAAPAVTEQAAPDGAASELATSVAPRTCVQIVRI